MKDLQFLEPKEIFKIHVKIKKSDFTTPKNSSYNAA